MKVKDGMRMVKDLDRWIEIYYVYGSIVDTMKRT